MVTPLMKYIPSFIAGILCAVIGLFLWTLFPGASFVRKDGADSHFARFEPDKYIGVIFTKDAARFSADYLGVLILTNSGLVVRTLELPKNWSREILITKNRNSGLLRVGDVKNNRSYTLDLSVMQLVEPEPMALIRDEDEVLLLLKMPNMQK